MNSNDIIRLQQTALHVREHIVHMAGRGGCFIGASLSCVEILTYLYGSGAVHISPHLVRDPLRDIILLSKGHDVPALYGVFAELGYLDRSRLLNHMRTNDSIYWHPNVAIAGVEFHAGSLGHLLSVGMGMALDCKISDGRNRVIIVTGDGELNEGSMWEGLLVASAKKLDNLTLIVDRNEFQANLRTEDLVPLESLEEKFRAFGCAARSVDGHDFGQLDAAWREVPFSPGKPSVVIAKTVRGKGIPSIERKADRWFMNCSPAEVEELLRELHGVSTAKLESEGMVVR